LPGNDWTDNISLMPDSGPFPQIYLRNPQSNSHVGTRQDCAKRTMPVVSFIKYLNVRVYEQELTTHPWTYSTIQKMHRRISGRPATGLSRRSQLRLPSHIRRKTSHKRHSRNPPGQGL